MMEQTHVFGANPQKELLSEYKRNSNNKSRVYAKFLADKKALITILFGQYDEPTKTKIALGAICAADRQAGRFSAFIKQMRTVCFGGDEGGLLYRPYKQIVAIKLLNIYIINEFKTLMVSRNRSRLNMRPLRR